MSVLDRIRKWASQLFLSAPESNQEVSETPRESIICHSPRFPEFHDIETWYEAWYAARSAAQKILDIPHAIDLSNSDLRGVNFRGLSYMNAVFKNSTFVGCNMRDGDFQFADFRGCNLSDADLRGAVFIGANLQGANLKDALVSGARFDYSNIVLSNFDAKGVHSAALTEALWSGKKKVKPKGNIAYH